MIYPTPLLASRPHDLGDVFSGTLAVLRRAYWQLVLIALIPVLPVAAGVALIVGGSAGLETVRGTPSAQALAPVAAGFLLLLSAGLLNLKSEGLTALGAYETARGIRWDLSGLWSRNRGFLRRCLGVMALAVAVTVVATVAVSVALAGTVAAVSYRSSEAGVGVLMGLLALTMLVVLPLSYFLTVKWLYWVPIVAIEEAGGLPALGRSWRLTAGAFWRTLGYYLLASLIVSAVAAPASLLTQPLMVGMYAMDPSPSTGLSRLTLIALLPQLLVGLATYPFLHAYRTVMFVDQVRRSETTAPPPSRVGVQFVASPQQPGGAEPGYLPWPAAGQSARPAAGDPSGWGPPRSPWSGGG